VEGLDARDASLAKAIHDSTVRRWRTLCAVLTLCLSRPFDQLEPKMKAVLLAGAAQLLLLDRVPDHAAVSESVAWAKRHIRPKAGGLVNAVLRRVQKLTATKGGHWEDRRDQILLSDGRSCDLTSPILPEDPVDRLAVQASLPTGIVRRWIDAQGPGRARQAALQSLCIAPTVLNVSAAEAPVPHCTPHSCEGSAVFTGSLSELASLLDARDDVWVQDAASARAIPSVRELVSPKLIVDLCAGRGTKTRQLAAVFPDAEIIACDVDRARAEDLAGTFRSHRRVRVMPLREVLPAVAGRADLVLLDVPCSNSGVLARRPEARYRLGREQTRRLAQIQRQLIADAVPMLSADGAILYSTCSLEPEEDAEPLAWAHQWHGLRTACSELVWPSGEPGAASETYHDGSFFALLVRS